MNESWNTMTLNTSMMSSLTNRPKDEVSMNDINALLRGRSYATKKEDEKPIDMNPTIPEYNEEDMKELEEYCKKRGIVGVNFGNRNPRAVLEMLKGRMGDRTSKRGLLNG